MIEINKGVRNPVGVSRLRRLEWLQQQVSQSVRHLSTETVSHSDEPQAADTNA